jgi:hypothetical protein
MGSAVCPFNYHNSGSNSIGEGEREREKSNRVGMDVDLWIFFFPFFFFFFFLGFWKGKERRKHQGRVGLVEYWNGRFVYCVLG